MKIQNKQQTPSSSLIFSRTFLSDEQLLSNEGLLSQLEPQDKSKIRLAKNNNREDTDLLLYVSKVDDQDTKSIQSVENTLDNSEEEFFKIKNRKISLNKRIKTQTYDSERIDADEINRIKLENKLLKSRLIYQQKRIISLESYEGEVQYLKKLCVLQNQQIQKLRKQLRSQKCQHLKLSVEEHKTKKASSIINIQSQQKAKDPILISEDTERGTKKKCMHKAKQNKRQSSNHQHKTQIKGHIIGNQNFSLPLKDKQEMQNPLQKTFTNKHGKYKKQKNIHS